MHGCQKMMKGKDEAEFLASHSRGKLGWSRVLLLHSVFVSGVLVNQLSESREKKITEL